ncbi:STAS/SEC14 domain-containing protein [Curvivirga sp.]|uniref:DUF7793 family protein n=1 Tax=Curvivirga sp. TaxID=2856848 RepID=UPI003B5C25E6
MITIEPDTYFEDGIVITDYKDILIDLDVIKRSFNKRRTIANDKESLVLLKVNALSSLGQEVQDFIISDEVIKHTKAVAIVPTSKAAAIISNTFLSSSSSPYPIQVFKEIENAKDWLNSIG